MILALLLGCATPIWGVWMFTLDITPSTGDECSTTVTHNFAGAHEPEESSQETPWTEESTSSQSSSVFFGRVEESGQGLVLLVGTEVYPGKNNEDGSSEFSWKGTESGTYDKTHASGYAFAQAYEDQYTETVKGTFNNDVFTGTFSQGLASFDKWDESDTWSDEAAIVVTDTGAIPAWSYLVLTDGMGNEQPVTNTRGAYDCDSAGCTLSVESACAYSYDLTGQLTDIEDDDRWVRDATQPAGI